MHPGVTPEFQLRMALTRSGKRFYETMLEKNLFTRIVVKGLVNAIIFFMIMALVFLVIEYFSP